MDKCKKKTVLLCVICTVVCLLLLPTNTSVGQSVPDSFMARQEQARILERDIGVLEGQLAESQGDWIAVSQKLDGLEKKVMASYFEIDQIEEEIENSKRDLNKRVRSMYMEGKAQRLIDVLNASDLSEFMVKYDYLSETTSRGARVLGELREKRQKLGRQQAELIECKQEAARLARSSDPRLIEGQLEQKRKQFVDISSEIISMELPETQAPAPTDFNATRVYSKPEEAGFVMTGQVLSGYSSWYGNEFHGRGTASGEVFDQYAFTCAHKTLPFGTWLKVTFRGRSVIVKVNDRGPFVKGRIFDLSRGAAEAIGLTGIQWVDCEIIIPKAT